MVADPMFGTHTSNKQSSLCVKSNQPNSSRVAYTLGHTPAGGRYLQLLTRRVPCIGRTLFDPTFETAARQRPIHCRTGSTAGYNIFQNEDAESIACIPHGTPPPVIHVLPVYLGTIVLGGCSPLRFCPPDTARDQKPVLGLLPIL